MAELTIDPTEIASVLRKYLDDFHPTVAREQVGRVLYSGDGIARVSGLPECMANERLEFPRGVSGVALNLEENEIGAVILGDPSDIEEGDPVKLTGEILSVAVGDAMLGRVIDVLGNPIDGGPPLDESKVAGRRPLEVQAPSVVQRQPVKEPLYFGVKAVDAMTAVGRGQRELIIGDMKTGKTAIGVDAIINQRQFWGTDKQVKCIYVAVGQKDSTVAQVVQALKDEGAMEYTVVVVAGGSRPAPFKYLAPYVGSAIGQHWMYNGEHALIVYDDLSKQAEAYREISLLLRRPAGREAYPGDVFYLHSRLLERGAKLSDALGAGSLTALPIVETKGGDISGYIPTNVISITDGQIYLEEGLFNAGVRPAINVGKSVSRVGGNAQVKAMKSVAGSLRLDLAAYRELEAFAAFGSELDKSSQRQLERGARLVELLKQPQYSPVSVQDQVIAIFTGTNGYLDDVPVADVKRFERELLEYVHSRKPEIPDGIVSTGTLPEDAVTALKAAIEEFKRGFVSSDGGPAKDERNVGWERTSASGSGEPTAAGSGEVLPEA
jgi:F-type H+-transporting ATPase subunit alpha